MYCKNMHAVEARSKKHIKTIKTNMLNNMKTPFCAVGVTQTSPIPMFWKESFVKMSTALGREHHFVKKDPSSEADLCSRLWKWARRWNGASTGAPKITNKNLKTAVNIPIMIKFQKHAFRMRVSENMPNENFMKGTKTERLSWECPKKQDNSKF